MHSNIGTQKRNFAYVAWMCSTRNLKKWFLQYNISTSTVTFRCTYATLRGYVLPSSGLSISPLSHLSVHLSISLLVHSSIHLSIHPLLITRFFQYGKTGKQRELNVNSTYTTLAPLPIPCTLQNELRPTV